MQHEKIANLATELHHGNISIQSLAIAIRIEWANNWLSPANCAQANGISVKNMERLIAVCRDIHEDAMQAEKESDNAA